MLSCSPVVFSYVLCAMCLQAAIIFIIADIVVSVLLDVLQILIL